MKVLYYDFWGHSDKDKDIFVHYENVNVETPTSIPIKLIYSYDYKNKILRFLTNNSSCYLVLSKDCNKRINKQLKNYNVTNLQGDDINKMIETYRNAIITLHAIPELNNIYMVNIFFNKE